MGGSSESAGWKVRARLCLLAILFWTAVGCIYALPGATAGDWRPNLLGSLAQWWSWGLLTPPIFAVDRWLPVSNQQFARRAVAHLVPSFVFTCAFIFVAAAVRALLGIATWNELFEMPRMGGSLLGLFLWSWLVYWLIVGCWQAYRYYGHYQATQLRMERLERSFSEARLNAMRMQLDPHFLFNALNTISSQVERDPKLARAMIGHLGDLLRLSLESRDRHEIPLGEEMAFLEHYLAIQRIRFGDSLRFEERIAPEVRHALVPSLVIQPLVENAIRHGISGRSAMGTVTVSAQRIGDRLEIRILDDGVGLPPGWALETSSGLGLSVTRSRIAALDPSGNSRFAVKRRAEAGTEVEIMLPLRFPAKEEAFHAT
ncbi:MAG TPA: histidine kinase [Bryobacteraceae bacterium]|jgi:signal transduction histidine kinase|nr:histidine kinase [Bryobacteraceae bacterium]